MEHYQQGSEAPREADIKTVKICSRGIRNALHFHYALVLVIKAVCGIMRQ